MPIRLALAATLSVLVLAACTGALPTLGGAQSASADAAGGNPAAGQTTIDAPQFNPFFDGPASAQGQREVLANPSMQEIMQAGALPEMALGRADAPVTIVQYASMSCPHCRQFQAETFPLLKKEFIDSGKLRYVLRAEFPIGKQAGLATVALRCAPPTSYFVLYDKLMAQQATWVSQEVRPDPIFKVAAQVGMTRAQFDKCRENRGMIAALNGIKERGRTLGVIGTPNFFVQGKLVKSQLAMKDIHALVDPILAGRVAQSEGASTAR